MTLWRHYVIVIGFAVIVIGLLIRVFHLSVFDIGFLQEAGSVRSERSKPIPATRGVIYDRRGEPLSVSTPMIAVWIDPAMDNPSLEDLNSLAGVLGVSNESMHRKVEANRDKRFVYLARQLEPEIAQQIRDLETNSFRFETEYRRYYPMGEVLAHVVGITDIDDQGQEGLELAANESLRGKDGSRRIVQGRKGRGIRDVNYVAYPQYGRDLHLTIDSRLQYLCYEAIKETREKYNAKAASMILLHVDSGEILALANVPSYNPNVRGKRSFANMRNRAITDLYEPGSTIKPFLAIAAMESGAFSAETKIETSPGYIRVGQKLIEDPRDYGTLSLTNVMIKSSQVGATKIALTLEYDALLNVLERAGLSDFTQAGMPGETIGVLPIEDLHRQITQVTMAYGYGFSVTPLQIARGYLTLATGGIARQIKIVQGMNGPHDERVFKREHIVSLLRMLEGVVGPTGTAYQARIQGARVAGKTGTVRKVGENGYSEDKHVTLFAGMTPADKPSLVGVVVVDEPQGYRVSGGSIAAPLFADVLTQALLLLGHPNTQPTLLPRGVQNDAA